MTNATVTGVAAWAHISKPSKESTIEYKGRKSTIPSRYSIDVFLSDDSAAKLKKAGFAVKNAKADVSGIPNSAGKPFLQVKKPAEYKSGDATQPPICVDSQLDEYKGLIGNGSKVVVKFKAVEYEIMGREGISARLEAVQVTELVSYSASGGTEGFEKVKGGFKASDAPVVEEEAPTPPVGLDAIAEAKPQDLEF